MSVRIGRSGLRVLGIVTLIAAMLAGLLAVSVQRDQAEAASTVTFVGHGYGHGRGMSQYGAYGYATNYSWTYAQILKHFYGGTALSTQANSSIGVRLMAFEGRPMVVTSGSTFTVGGVAMTAGSAGTVSLRPDGKFNLAISPGCGKAATRTVVVPNGKATSSVAAPGNVLSKMLTLCGADRRTYRGSLNMINSGGTHVINTVPMEDYLRGVIPRESPASWGDAAGGKGMQALMAQAVAARSYAYSETRTSYAKTCDTTSCQVYGGAGLNGVLIEDARTNTAIVQSAQRVIRNGAGAIVRAEFSSSSGGYTAGGVWPAVPDLGDAVSPRHNWSVSVPATTIAANLGVGTLVSITVLSRNGLGADGGRVMKVRVTGSSRSVEITGTAMRSAAGLYSDWFAVQSSVAPPPLVINADGFGTRPLPVFAFGLKGDRPLTCDFDGNGADSVGVYRVGTFYLKNNLGAGPSTSFPFGNNTDRPVCGDWNGDGKGTIGIYRPGTSTFYLRNSNSAGGHNLSYQLGLPGDVPVVGDWNGDGIDTVGVYRPSTAMFYLINAHSQGAPRLAYAYGSVGLGDLPVVGDWNGDGKDTLGVWRANRFYLADALGALSVHRFSYGRGGDLPLAGDWNGNGTTTVGVGRGY